MTDRAEEALATYRHMVAERDRIEVGELPWSALAAYFTENAVYIDSAWGRFEGRPAIRQFMADSMLGLEDWRFPEEWTMADGDRVVSMWWNQLPGNRADGSLYRVAGLSLPVIATNDFSDALMLLAFTGGAFLIRRESLVAARSALPR